MRQRIKTARIFLILLCLILVTLTGCDAKSTLKQAAGYLADEAVKDIEEGLEEFAEDKQEEAAEGKGQADEDSKDKGRNNKDKNGKKKNNKKPGQLEVHYIDIGQGDATLITCDGAAMLIDAGDNSKGTAVQNYLQKQGIKKLDYVIGTHPDADHIGGLDVILYKFDCDTIIMPDIEHDTRTYDDVVQTMKTKNYKNTLPVVGETYSLGSASFTVIAPNHYDYGDNNNNYSVGIILENGKHRFLFIGDAEEAAEEDILANGIDIHADVYKVAHHGSDTASTEELLDAVKPQYAVISCGKENRYGHPHEEVLQRLESRNITTYRTDEAGTVVAYTNGKKLTWNR